MTRGFGRLTIAQFEASGAGTMQDAFLTRDQVSEITSLSRATIWRAQRRGEFPNYEQLSAGRVGLKRSTLDEWLLGRRDWGVVQNAA
jgi:prophage regulatory protein